MNEEYEKKIQADVDTIFTLMAQRVDEKQMNLLHDAYSFAAYAHKDQLRKSGEPYITPIRDKIAISCMLREIHEFSSHAIRHGLYIKNRKRLFCP